MAKNTQRSSSSKITDTQKNNNPDTLYSRKDENYITIFGWMTNRLKLSGNELLVYALIFSFAKDGITEFHGSAEYIASALNMSRRTVVSTLKSLTNNGLIKKRVIGRYCHYTVPPVQNLHTSSAEIAQVSVQNLHSTSAKIAHHIKSISKEDIKSSSNEPTTTFLNFCISERKAKELCTDIDPSWLSGTFTYPEYIAEAIRENYPDKPQDQKNKLFITLFTAEDRKAMFPQWKQEQETAAAEQEAYRQKEAAEQEHNRKLEVLKKAGPQSCENCGTTIEAPNTIRGECPSCGYYYIFNEEIEAWEFSEPFNFSAALKETLKKKSSVAQSEEIDF